MRKIIFDNWYITVLLSAFILFSCSAAKSISKQVDSIKTSDQTINAYNDSVKKAGIADFVALNPCQPYDVDMDSACGLLGYNNRRCPVLIMDSMHKIDTVILPGKVSIKYIADPRALKLKSDSIADLQGQIGLLKIQLSGCQGNLTGHAQAIIEEKPVITPWYSDKWFWILIALLAGVIGTYFIKSKL